MSDKTHMNDSGESYSAIVPTKRSNESQGGPKEIAEGRALTEENAEQPNSNRTPSRDLGLSGLERVREAARRDKQLKFTALLHHINIDLLRRSYCGLKRQAAPGVDGVVWRDYGEGLEERLADLHGRIHRRAYRAKPSLRKWIPKGDGSKQRPLGSRRWRTKSSRQRRFKYSTRSGKRTSRDSHTASGRGAVSMTHWMRCTPESSRGR